MLNFPIDLVLKMRGGRGVQLATMGTVESGPTGTSRGGLLHWPFARHNRTPFVEIDTGKCKACGGCVAECPRHALKLIAFFWHRHVKVARASACIGCRRCVRRCEQRAIRPRNDTRDCRGISETAR